MLHNGYQTGRLLIGVMYAGFTVAPLNLLAQPSQLAYVLDHSDTRLVLHGSELTPSLPIACAPRSRIFRCAIKVVVIDPDAPDPSLPIRRRRLPQICRPVAEDDDALLMYTSGTTGKPKGVVLSQKSVVAGGEFTSRAHHLTADDRVMCALPLYHINGQIVTAVAPLVHGGSVVMPHRFSVTNYWETVVAHHCTWINVVPTILAYLLNAPDPRASGLDLDAVKFCRSASAPLPPELHRAFEEKFGISIIETFGMTETNAPSNT